MYFTSFLASGLGSSFTNTGFFIAIAVLACILGAEIAGICILISKMLRARKAKQAYEEQLAYEEQQAYHNGGDYRSNAFALPIIMLGAIPQTSYIALSVLMAVTAVAALVFVVLLIIFRAKGYDFATAAWYREELERRKPIQEATPELSAEEETPTTVFTNEEQVPVFADEEQQQDAYTEIDEDPLDAFDPESADEAAQTLSEDEPAAEADEPEAELPVAMPAVTETQTQTQTQTVGMAPVVNGEPLFADGTRPYKVVEKIVTETVKEVVTETPPPAPVQPTPAAKESSATDAVMEKLTEFLDYELQKRKENDQAESEKSATQNSDGSVATFAKSGVVVEEDDDEEDEIETDEDEAEEGEKLDDDRDDEEDEIADDRFTGNERIIGFNEETGCYIVAHYRKSFEAKLIQARPNIKKYYSDLKNALLSYKGTKDRISWSADSFHNGREQIAKINVKTRILELYLAIDPASLEGTVYRGTDVSSKKKYAEVPFRYKLRTPRKFKWAMELVQRVCEEHGLSPIDIEHVDYEQQYPFDTTENLIERKLIKEYIREEKPSTTFELDPDYVPEMPQEDESVIPANANFTWEFDNERMEEKEPEPQPEPEPVPEPVVEPEPQPEPQPEPEPEPEPVPQPEPEPAPAPQPTVVRETVKVTEMRYTERYYADPKPTYEQVITTHEPIEVSAIDIAEPVVEEPTVTEPVLETIVTDEPVVAETVTVESVVEETAPIVAEEDAVEEAVIDDPDARMHALFDEEPIELPVEDVEVEQPEEESAEPEELFFAESAEEELPSEATAVEEDPAQEPVEEQPLPFRPSFYANRNYYESESTAEETVEETVAEEPVVEEAVYEEIAVEEPIEEAITVESSISKAPQKAVDPEVAVVDICAVAAEFPQGATVSLETLKAKELILPTAKTLKIDASGALTKAFTVEANHITFKAAMAILSAGGEALQIQ